MWVGIHTDGAYKSVSVSLGASLTLCAIDLELRLELRDSSYGGQCRPNAQHNIAAV